MTFPEEFFLGCSSSTGFPERTKLTKHMVGLLVTWERQWKSGYWLVITGFIFHLHQLEWLGRPQSSTVARGPLSWGLTSEELQHLCQSLWLLEKYLIGLGRNLEMKVTTLKTINNPMYYSRTLNKDLALTSSSLTCSKYVSVGISIMNQLNIIINGSAPTLFFLYSGKEK